MNRRTCLMLPGAALVSAAERHEDSPPDQKPGFKVENGLLVSLPENPEDDLWCTREKIRNATLCLVYKVSDPRANSGVFIRIPEKPKSEDDAIHRGIEVQIGDTGDWHCTGVKLNDVLVTDYDGVSPVPSKRGKYEPERGPRPDTDTSRSSIMVERLRCGSKRSA
jgi:hypothetical protein